MDQSEERHGPAAAADAERRATGAAAAAGPLDPQRFADLFQASFRVLWCIGVAVHGDRNLADDTLQEAAVIALGKLDQFDPTTSFSAWMGQIVRFVALNQLRRTARNPVSSIDPAIFEHAPAAPDQARPSSTTLTDRGDLSREQVDFDDRTAAALMQLEADARCCLLLRTLLHMPYREIARALDIPEGTAMSHVHRARRQLRAQLSNIADAREHGGSSDD